ncbi:MAG: hypothetical protein COA96_06655 [SAR86 cluster bacterium]|uniref:TonB-dependent receptor n=1 Tax=SAR86 cluster bacterium TaxID=2030880 RepID=A0A2A5B3L8_9GAMM|nr:MAG: hypothetical protein COA96_06655 [SAR86 cluster bacterium]
MRLKLPQIAPVLLAGFFLQGPSAVAQIDSTIADNSNTTSFRVSPGSVFTENMPQLSIVRSVEEKDFQGAVVEDALNFNLGLQLEPLSGLNIRADVWRMQVDQGPSANIDSSDWHSNLPKLYLDDSQINEFNLENPLLGSNIESNGFDVGASYVWNTSKFGQFTLSSKTTYVQDFENNGGLLDFVGSDIASIDERLVSPELQSSLMLTWQFGNHTASAITNYFDSYKDISELDIDEINDLVDSITTFDLQYGYSVKTGSKDRAVISFGIRNIFNEKTSQILNSTTRILDQNGRVAYGSIKYQF